MTDIERPHRALNSYRFVLLGGASGALYALLQFGLLFKNSNDILSQIGGVLMWIGAGLFYGVIVGGYLRRELDWHIWKWPAFVVAASISYAAAVYLAIKLSSGQLTLQQQAGVGALAGGVGALLLDLATAALSQRARHLKFLIPTALIGALLGAFIAAALNSDSVAVWVAFFAVWQAAYAAWSAMTLSRSMLDT